MIDMLLQRGRVLPGALQLVPITALLLPWQEPGGTAASWAAQRGLAYRAPAEPAFHTATQLVLFGRCDELTSETTRRTLLMRYPAAHQIVVVDADGALLQDAALSEMAALPTDQRQVVLIAPALPALADVRNPRGLQRVTERLLAPGGCPWDVEQDHQTLRGALLEEVYEVLEALDTNDMPALRDELGDLLIAVMTHSEMARQAGHFAFEDVVAAVTQRLIGRHPHVFATRNVADVSEVLANWEAIKATELRAAGRTRTNPLDGVPPALPALATAQKLLKKAKRSGFDWPHLPALWAKFDEESAEFRSAVGSAAREAELGDLVLVLADLALYYDIDAETAVREATQRFRRRFRAMVDRLSAADPAQVTAEMRAAAWRQAARTVQAVDSDAAST